MATDTNRYTIKKWNDDGKLILEEIYINGEIHISDKSQDNKHSFIDLVLTILLV